MRSEQIEAMASQYGTGARTGWHRANEIQTRIP
jgi:hypothetical protein